MNTGKYIYTKLKATAAVTALIGSGDNTRLYPVYLPQNVAYPAVVFTVANVPHHFVKDQPSDIDRAKVTFHIWASAAQGENGYQQIEDIDAAIRTALDYVEGTAGGVTVVNCHYDGSTDGRDEEMTLYMREAIYTVMVKN